MNTSAFDHQEQQVLRRALEYWAEHWDWECPTLFGVEKNDFSSVLQTWPTVTAGAETTALAALGALRELLYGASAPERVAIHATLGITFADAEGLCSKTLILADQVLS